MFQRQEILHEEVAFVRKNTTPSSENPRKQRKERDVVKMIPRSRPHKMLLHHTVSKPKPVPTSLPRTPANIICQMGPQVEGTKSHTRPADLHGAVAHARFCRHCPHTHEVNYFQPGMNPSSISACLKRFSFAPASRGVPIYAIMYSWGRRRSLMLVRELVHLAKGVLTM